MTDRQRRKRLTPTQINTRQVYVYHAPSRATLQARSRRDIFIAAIDPNDPTLLPTVLTGRLAVRENPDTDISAFLLPLNDEECDLIACTDETEERVPSVLARSAYVIWKAGLRLDQVSKALALDLKKSATQRVVDAGRSLTPYAFNLLDEDRITWGHVRHLVNLSPGEQEKWAGETIAKGLSSAALKAAIENKPVEPDADLVFFQRQLQESLKTDGLTVQDRGNGKYTITLNWSHVQVLQQALSKLGDAPNREQECLPVKARSIVFEIESKTELDAFTAHLY